MDTRSNMVKSEGKQPERIQQQRVVTPLVDVFENAHEVLLFADMPGISEKDINIRFEKNQLSLEGRYEGQREEQNGQNGLNGQSFVYARGFVLPSGVDPEKITADLRNGVLQVHLPKRDSLKPRQITVKGA